MYLAELTDDIKETEGVESLNTSDWKDVNWVTGGAVTSIKD